MEEKTKYTLLHGAIFASFVLLGLCVYFIGASGEDLGSVLGKYDLFFFALCALIGLGFLVILLRLKAIEDRLELLKVFEGEKEEELHDQGL